MTTTTKKSVSNAWIPEELLIEILARLPVKSLLRFRSVCKSWYSLITNPSFITTHLNRTKSNHSHKLLIKFNYENRDRCLSFTDDETFGDEFVKLEYPFQNYNEFKIVGSCDGLLCLSDYYGSDYAVLWNPSIRRFMKLPKSGSSVTKARRLLRFDFGFGFDHMSNDYKVVKIVCAKDNHRRYVVRRVELFALSMGSWRPVCIGDLCYELYGFDSLPVFVNGAAHWVVFNLRKDCVCILAFDIVEEVFREIALPNHQIDVILRTDVSIIVLGKSLAVILYEAVFTSVKTIGTNHVWVMEEYGVIESWTKGCRMIGKQRWLTVLGSRKNGDVLMVQDGLPGPRELVSCDTKSRQIKHLGLHGHSFYVSTYMESLFALDVADGVWKSHVRPNFS